MRNWLVALAMLLAAVTAAPGAAHAGEDSFVGEIILVASTFCPRTWDDKWQSGYWAEAAGQEIAIGRGSKKLFAVLGKTFGGDGKETFALPDLRDKVPQSGMRYCVSFDGLDPHQPIRFADPDPRKPVLGQIILAPYAPCPRRWVETNGEVVEVPRLYVDIQDNSVDSYELRALRALMAGQDGGRRREPRLEQFRLPNLTGAVPAADLRYCMATHGLHPAESEVEPLPPGSMRMDARGPFLGEVMLIAHEFCPQPWIEADGRTIRIADDPTLFAWIGNQFGGNGRTTFKLPDLRDKAPLPGLRYCFAIDGVPAGRS